MWWLSLLARPKWGPAHVLRGVEAAGSPQEAWDRWFLREPSEAMTGRDTARRWLEAAHSEGMHVCTLDDPSYPLLLRELTDAPPVLFWRGTWPSEEGGQGRWLSWGPAIAQQTWPAQRTRSRVTGPSPAAPW